LKDEYLSIGRAEIGIPSKELYLTTPTHLGTGIQPSDAIYASRVSIMGIFTFPQLSWVPFLVLSVPIRRPVYSALMAYCESDAEYAAWNPESCRVILT